jgi:hypothetical protein
MTYPPPPGPDPVIPPPPDPPIQAYQPPIQGYGYPPAPPSPYATPSYPAPPYLPPRPTEGLAIASLVVSCAGILGLCLWSIGGLLGVIGAILGHVARRRIRATGAGGAGLALGGIIVGWIVTAVALAGFVALLFFVTQEPVNRY